jgi:hypothetical protein
MPSIYNTKPSILKTVNLIIKQACAGVYSEILAYEIMALHLLADQLGVDVNTVTEQMKNPKVNTFETTLFNSSIIHD